MKPDEYKHLIGVLGLSVYASADVLGVSLRTAQRYAAGEKPIPPPVAKLLRALVALGRTDV